MSQVLYHFQLIWYLKRLHLPIYTPGSSRSSRLPCSAFMNLDEPDAYLSPVV